MRHHVNHDTLARKLVPGDLVATRQDASMMLGELDLSDNFPSNKMRTKTIKDKSIALIVAAVPYTRDATTFDYAFLLMPQNVGWVFSADNIESGLVTHDGMPYNNAPTLARVPRSSNFWFRFILQSELRHHASVSHNCVEVSQSVTHTRRW